MRRQVSGIIKLADLFMISKTTVSKIVLAILDVFFKKLSLLNYRPQHPELTQSMLMCFRARYEAMISAVIDCFEIFIDRQNNLAAYVLNVTQLQAS